MIIPVRVRARFFKCWVQDEKGCWIWRRATNGVGYGKIGWGRNKRVFLIDAHRLAWIIANGAISKGKMVLHRCDIRLCVNPKHLFLGTAKDNTQDMLAKGRGRHQVSKI